MPTLNEMFPGRFLRAADLKNPAKVAVREVKQESMFSKWENQKVEKWVAYFRSVNGRDLDKGLVLNITNGKAIADVAGSRESQDWIGAVVELYPTTVNVAGSQKRAIRVREARNGKGGDS